MRLLAATAATLLALAGCAITPTVQWQSSTFEGFPVISYVPDHPRGMVYLFHGSNGSANFAQRVETVDVLNRLVARGYGFVSTSSTERTGDKRWNVTSTSLTANPDLARLMRLQAIWASHGTTANAFDGPGQLTVPTIFSTSDNDFTVPPTGVVANYVTATRSGTPTQLYVSHERRLNPAQYERIPGIDPDEAKQIVAALEATGVWNSQGQRVEPDIQKAVTRAATVNVPASVRPSASEIENETALLLAVHQFTAEYAEPAIAFFNQYVP
jgi:hypothetical protein